MAFGKGGGYGQTLPAGIGQMLSQGNAAMAQGIMNLSDEIGSAMKERAKAAKTKKKETDIAKSFLTLAFDEAKESGGRLPQIADASGKVMNLVREDIPNLTYDEAVPAVQGMMQFQKYAAGEAGIGATEGKTDLTSKQGEYLDKQIAGYDESEDLKNRLTEANALVAEKSIEKTDLDMGTKRATLQAVADMVTMPRPYGAMDDAEAIQMRFAAAAENNPGLDASVMLKAHNDMTEAAAGPFKPEAVSIPLPDGTTGTAITTSRNSAQVLQQHSASGASFKNIKDENGKVVAIGIPDGKGGFTDIKHLKAGFKPSDFDVDGDGLLKGSELTDFRVAFGEGDAMNLMLFDSVFKTEMQDGVKVFKLGEPPKKKKSGSGKTNVPGTAQEVKSAFEKYLKANPDG